MAAELAKVPELIDFPREDVYEPSDDTFLFLDALQAQSIDIAARLGTGSTIVELGCGSGAVMTYLGKTLREKHGLSGLLMYGIDVNPSAVRTARKTASFHGLQFAEFIQSDLFTNVQLEKKIDVLLFNPPYVPTESEEVGSKGIAASWAGGLDGREVVDRLLPQIPEMLTRNGVFYMITVAENKPQDIARIMQGYGFIMETIRQKKAFNEHLAVQKFVRINN